MKKYIITFLLLVLVGLGIAYVYFEKNRVLHHQSITEIEELLDEISLNDKNLNLSLMQLGHGIDNNYDLISSNVKINQRNLKDLRAVLNSAPIDTTSMATSLDEYEQVNKSKIDLVESFKTSNSGLLNSVSYAPFIGSLIARELNKLGNDDDSNYVSDFNSILVRYISLKRKSSLQELKSQTSELESIVSKYSSNKGFGVQASQYLNHVRHLLSHMEPTRTYLKKATKINTLSSINNLEIKMRETKASLKENLSNLRNIFIGYSVLIGFLVAGLLLIMRHLFSGKGSPAVKELIEKIAFVSEKIQSPLNFVGKNLNDIDTSYQSVKTTIGGLDGVVSEASKRTKDSRQINAMVTKTLNDYVKLKSTGKIEETESKIQGSTVGLNEINKLIVNLKQEGDKFEKRRN